MRRFKVICIRTDGGVEETEIAGWQGEHLSCKLYHEAMENQRKRYAAAFLYDYDEANSCWIIDRMWDAKYGDRRLVAA